jgi:hypothetical protein
LLLPDKGPWPGMAPISGGTIDAAGVTFVVIRRDASFGGTAKMTLDGTRVGDELRRTLTWGSRESSRIQSDKMAGQRLPR